MQFPQVLGKLILWLELQESTRQLAGQWSTLTSIDSDGLPFNQVIGRYRELQSWLDNVLTLGEEAKRIEKRINAINGDVHCVWHDIEAVRSLRSLLAALVSQHELSEASRKLAETETLIRDEELAASSAPRILGS